jgi:hypothetical protein
MGSINFKAPVVIAHFNKVMILFLFLIYRKPKLLACSQHFPMINQNQIFNPPPPQYPVHTEKSNKMQQCIKIYYSVFIRSLTYFGLHTAHHQEPKTALAASGFAYVEGC